MVSAYDCLDNAIAFFALLGGRLGVADMAKATVRATISGALAMVLTSGIGTLLGPVR